MQQLIAIIFVIFTVSLFPLSACALEIEKLADDDWLLVKSQNFNIITDLNAEKGTSLARDLESYRHFSIDMMGLKLLNVAKPLTVLAISSSSNFRRLELPENWAGVFNLDAEGYASIANVSNYRTNLKTQTFARQVLFHEYNHFLIRFSERTINFPMWYDEGMAEYMGTFKYDGEKIYLGDPSAVMGRAGDLFNMGGNMVLDVEKLLKKMSKKGAMSFPGGEFHVSRGNQIPDAIKEKIMQNGVTDLSNILTDVKGGSSFVDAILKQNNINSEASETPVEDVIDAEINQEPSSETSEDTKSE
jgi:hypothetical protein